MNLEKLLVNSEDYKAMLSTLTSVFKKGEGSLGRKEFVAAPALEKDCLVMVNSLLSIVNEAQNCIESSLGIKTNSFAESTAASMLRQVNSETLDKLRMDDTFIGVLIVFEMHLHDYEPCCPFVIAPPKKECYVRLKDIYYSKQPRRKIFDRHNNCILPLSMFAITPISESKIDLIDSRVRHSR